MPEPPRSPAHRPGFETLCAHWGEDPARYQGAVIPPLYQNSLFTFPNCEAWNAPATEAPRYDYTRMSNPTTDIAEAKIAALEGGERARCFGSGMGAISAAILSCVRSGDHVIAPQTAYGPTRQFLSDYLARFQIGVTFVDGSDPQDYADALQPNTRLFYLESPSSMIFKQQDLTALVALAKEQGASTVMDNSWATPYFQNPLAFGVDLVVHSATKYFGGHSDVVAGVAVGSAQRMETLIGSEGYLLGAVLDPFASWLLIRGLRTLAIRMERHQQTTRRIALALQSHPAVAQVFYPGLPDDPQAELTCRQLRGTSGLMSFALQQNTRQAAVQVADSLRYFGLGCSWGGFESLALPASIPARHLDGSDGEDRWVLRLHIGLETADDLWDDLCAALDTLTP